MIDEDLLSEDQMRSFLRDGYVVLRLQDLDAACQRRALRRRLPSA